MLVNPSNGVALFQSSESQYSLSDTQYLTQCIQEGVHSDADCVTKLHLASKVLDVFSAPSKTHYNKIYNCFISNGLLVSCTRL